MLEFNGSETKIYFCLFSLRVKLSVPLGQMPNFRSDLSTVVFPVYVFVVCGFSL